MEGIENYLNNIFAAYPQTPEVLRIKEELLGNMEERYNALISQGKNNEEALGVVISEFGNMEELAKEMGLTATANSHVEYDYKYTYNYNEPQEEIPPTINYVPLSKKTVVSAEVYTLPEEEAIYFLDTSRKAGLIIGMGVASILVGTGIMTFLANINASVIGMFPLFLGIAFGIGCFIYGGQMEENSGEKFLKKNRFQISPVTEQIILGLRAAEHAKTTLLLTLGIGLICMCPLPVTAFTSISDSDVATGLGVCLLLSMIGIGVWMITYSGVVTDSYTRLLKFKSQKRGRQPYDGGGYSGGTTASSDSVSYTVSNGQIHQAPSIMEYTSYDANRGAKSIKDAYWGVVLVIFLATGMLFGIWGINWIIWPLAGVIHGVLF